MYEKWDLNKIKYDDIGNIQRNLELVERKEVLEYTKEDKYFGVTMTS